MLELAADIMAKLPLNYDMEAVSHNTQPQLTPKLSSNSLRNSPADSPATDRRPTPRCHPGDRQVPGDLLGLDEHGAAPGADPLQPAAVGDPNVPRQPAEGHQGAGGDVGEPRRDLQQHVGRQGAGRLGRQVVPVSQAARRLRCRLPAQVRGDCHLPQHPVCVCVVCLCCVSVSLVCVACLCRASCVVCSVSLSCVSVVCLCRVSCAVFINAA